MRSSIPSLRDLSRSTAIIEISDSNEQSSSAMKAVEFEPSLSAVAFARQTQLSRHSRCLPFPYKKKKNNLIT
ncbi:hypothetical protein P5673_003329 [Acropora cervicornis]|uniref:Uncharacterized protein n=1 Tax=Acropora cervicornis TaxID=6130 RepID=A0AAD9R2I2_ACRCE|nr:hypothetical protein P5673_003329 [Acropora cervicornis]